MFTATMQHTFIFIFLSSFSLIQSYLSFHVLSFFFFSFFIISCQLHVTSFIFFFFFFFTFFSNLPFFLFLLSFFFVFSSSSIFFISSFLFPPFHFSTLVPFPIAAKTSLTEGFVEISVIILTVIYCILILCVLYFIVFIVILFFNFKFASGLGLHDELY